MKKVTLFWRLMVVLLLSSVLVYQADAQMIEYGTHYTTASYNPAYGYYDYSFSKNIYLNQFLGSDPYTIEKLGWELSVKYGGSNPMANQTIWVKEVDFDTWSNSNPITDPGGNGWTAVWSGDLSLVVGWNELELDAPFEYTGENNLAIYWANNDGSYSGNNYGYWWCSYRTIYPQSAYRYQDYSFPTYGYYTSYLPMLRVYYSVPPGEVNGTVYDANSGDEIMGAKVTAYNDFGSSYQFTGPDGAYLFTMPGGTYNLECLKPGYQTQTITNVTIPPNGVTTVNFNMTEALVPPSGAYAEIREIDLDVVDITWGVPDGLYEIIYDDGVADNMTAWLSEGSFNALKFTPVEYPVTIISGSVFIGDGTYPPDGDPLQTFNMAIYDDDGEDGFPGTMLGIVEVTPENFGWVAFDIYRPGEEIILDDGEFYLAMQQGGNWPDCAPIGIDNTEPVYRSYSKNQTGPWIVAAFQDFMIRAVVSGPGGAGGTLTARGAEYIPAGRQFNEQMYLNSPRVEGGYVGEGLYIPRGGGETTRDFSHYEVYRVNEGDEFIPENWTLLAGFVPVPHYTDNAWESLPDGGYRWAVTAVYDGGTSDASITNMLGLNMLADITFVVTLSSDGDPSGAYITMFNQDGLPEHQYSAIAPDDGIVVFEDVWKGTYDMQISKVNFDTWTMNSYDIGMDEVFEVELQEITDPPVNLFVDPLTLLATWDAPSGFIQVLYETWNSGWNGWTGDPEYGNWSVYNWYGNPSPSARFYWSPSYTDYSFSLVSPEIDAAVLETLFLEFDIYLSNFSTATTENLTVEVWDGGAWIPIVNFSNQSGSIPWTHHTFDISAVATGHATYVRFNANGGDCYNINNWNIDNINLTSTYSKGVIGYNVYLDGIIAGFTELDYYYYNPIFINWGQTYVSAVDAYYASGYSSKAFWTWTSIWLPPPRNLEGEDVGHTAWLYWEAPVSPSMPDGPSWEEVMAFNGVQLEYIESTPSAALAPVGGGQYIDLKSPEQIDGIEDPAYGYNAYPNSGSDPTGPCEFILGEPGDLMPFGTAGADFISTADWINDTYYGVVYGGALITLDVETGEYTSIATTVDLTGLALDPSTGNVYGCNFSGAIYLIDIETGASTLIGNSGRTLIAMTCTNGGQLFGVDIGSDQTGYINKETGAWTPLANLGFNANYAQDMAIDRTTDVIYYAAFNSTAFSGQLYIVDPITGTLTFVGNFEGGAEITGFAVPGGGSGPIPDNLVNYNIYRDNEFIGTSPADTPEYFDTGLLAGFYDYEVSAVYSDPTEGESLREGVATIYINGEGTFTGTVSEFGTQFIPIVGATVTAYNDLGTYVTTTGAGGVYVLEDVMEGTYTICAEADSYETQCVDGVFLGDSQVVEQNFNLFEFPYPVIGVWAERNQEQTECFVNWFEWSDFYILSYNDGIADNVTAWDKAFNYNALRFTPLGYPAQIFAGEVNIYDGTWPSGDILQPFDLIVFDDDGAGGLPGTELGRRTVTPFDYGWIYGDFSNMDIVIDDGDFYIAMEQSGDYPNCAPIAVDESNPVYMSYQRYASANEPWRNSDFADFMFNAYIYTEADGPVVINHYQEVEEVTIASLSGNAISMKPGNVTPGTYQTGFAKAVPKDAESTREIENYAVYLVEAGDETNPDEWLLKDDMVYETNYADTDWDSYNKGWYRYAVVAVYTYNEAAPVLSNLVPRGFDHSATINVKTDTGESPGGAILFLSNRDGDPAHQFEVIVPDDGLVVIYQVWEGIYDLYVTLPYYNPYQLLGFGIYNDITLNVTLQELFLPPQDLFVDNMTGVATWLPPVLEYYTIMEEGFEGGAIPTGWTMEFIVEQVPWQVGFGGPAGQPEYPHSGEFNATFTGSSATTRLITPMINLQGEILPKLDFWHSQPAAGSGQDELKIYYKTSTTGSWKPLEGYIFDIPGWKHEIIDLPNPTSQYYIAFTGEAPEPAGAGISLDDVKVIAAIDPIGTDAGGDRVLEGYNVFLDGEFIAFTTELTYTYTDLVIGQLYVSGVNARYTSGTSLIIEFAFIYYTCDYFNPPTDFAGQVNGMDVILTWGPPVGGPVLEEFRWDDGVITAQLGYSGNNNAVLGAHHLFDSKIYMITWYCTSNNPLPSVNVCLFDLDPDGVPTELIFKAGADNTPDAWNTFVLSSPVDCPNGFLVGINTPDEFTSLGTDDGVDPPWEFVPGTQWITADYEGGVWENPEDYGFEFNFAVRAYGENFGPLSVDVVENTTQTVGSGIAPVLIPLKEPVVTEEPSRGGFDLLGFNVWRNDVKINPDVLPPAIYTYLDEVSPGGIYYYNVTAVYQLGQSCPIDPPFEAIVGGDLLPPTDLAASILRGDDVLLTWNAPGESIGTWIGWDDGENYGGLGLTDGGTWFVAARFAVEDLVAYDGQFLTKMTFVPGGNSGDTGFEVMVWTGADAANLMISQPVANPFYGDWNTVVFDEALEIDATQELWIGYSLIDQAPGEYPAGYDIGPEVYMKGGMISFDGVEWSSLYDLSGGGIDVNFNIKGYVTPAGAANTVVTPLTKEVVQNSGDMTLESVQVKPGEGALFVEEQTRETLLGYNMWRNGTSIAYIAEPDTSYVDPNLFPGTYEYFVSAMYAEGESFADGPATITLAAKGGIEGAVRDGMTGEVLPGAVITTDPLGFTATTGYDGRFEIAELPVGTYSVTCIAGDDYSPKTVSNVMVVYDEFTTVNFNMFGAEVMSMPFFEPWDAASFDDQYWTFWPEQGNWLMNTSVGNPAPTAEFSWTPAWTDYNFAMNSPFIDGSTASQNVTLKFDLFLSDYGSTGLEILEIGVLVDDEWFVLDQFTNTTSINWTTFSYDITEYALGNLFKVGFLAMGDDSFEINYWYVDNVKVYEVIMSTLQGTVSVAVTGNPVEGAMITVGEYDPVYTNSNGYYAIAVEQNTYEVECDADGYNIVEDELYITGTTTWDVMLTSPMMVITPEEINIALTNYNCTYTEYLTITNDGDGGLDWNAVLAILTKTAVENLELETENREDLQSLNPAQEWSPRVTTIINGNTDDMWDVQFVYDVTTAAGGTVSQAGVEFDGEFFYTTIWNTDQILKFSADGGYIGTYSISGGSNIRDLAWDGEYLYGGAAGTTIYQIDPETFEVVDQFGSPENVRAIAYDDNNDAFWVCDWSTDFWLVGRDGVMIDVIANPGVESNYGLAYDNLTGSPSLWVFSQGGSGADLVQLDIASGALTGVSRNVLNDIPAAGAPIAGGAFITTDYESGIVTLGGLIQADFNLVFGYELAAFDMWISMAPNSGFVLPGGGFGDTEVNIDLCGYDIGLYEAEIMFYSTPDVGTQMVPVTVDLTIGIGELDAGTISMYPNPARNFVNIEMTVDVKEIQILNYMGQVVYKTNVEDTQELQINTQYYSSGSYSVHFISTDNKVTTKKLVILK